VELPEQYTSPGKIQRAGRYLPFDWSGCDNTIFSWYQLFLGDRGLYQTYKLKTELSKKKKRNFFKEHFVEIKTWLSLKYCIANKQM